ncbi:uncharacterized protein LOC110455411 [Mizuhopecten yessoensis]|uniref:uncharacterized protein LOC110455411 n=1 Tax=Mizuhopecten yessoensis TaxID=6573 RepID=UPI000B458B13|nr:uncharacterized protein LOC110455411 [Mizuhopecten yessoensis]XP_021361211.1 uncharacterized protein LOC110455411 [Mizuhopecten yessoensis]
MVNMPIDLHTPESDTAGVQGDVIVIFSIWQFLIIALTLGVGVVAIGRIARVGCKNSPTIIVFLLCGFIHELYAIYILQTAKHIADTVTIQTEGCADFYSVCLVAMVVSLLAVGLSTIKETFHVQQSNTIRKIILIYTGIVLPSVIIIKSVGFSKRRDQLPSLQLKSELLYVTVCERDPYSDGLVTLLEYGTIYIPFVCLLFFMYRSQKAKMLDQEMKLSQLQCLSPCREGDVRYLCRTCTRINPVFAVTLVYYIFSIMVARPFYIGCSMVLGTQYKDLLPNITITALYVFVSLYCAFDIQLFPKRSPPASSDSVTDILIKPNNTQTRDRKPDTKSFIDTLTI